MRSSLILSVIGLFVSLTQAAPAASSAADELVLTPGGLRPKSNVHYVPPGSRIHHTDDSIVVHDAAGKVFKTFAKDPVAANATLARRTASGWVAYASWVNNAGSPISSFTTTWTVPPAPPANHGQTLFLFNSIEPASYNAILQPVLQWGPSAAGGGASWTVASWYVSNTQTFFTTLVGVSSGQSLVGSITLSSQSGSLFTYGCSFTNVGGTGMSLSNSPELTWATETLEVYGATGASDFPNGATTLGNINLRTVASSNPAVSWSPVSDLADGLRTTVVKNGAVGARVDIDYPN